MFGWDISVFGLTFSHLAHSSPTFYKSGRDIPLFGWYFFIFGYQIFLLRQYFYYLANKFFLILISAGEAFLYLADIFYIWLTDFPTWPRYLFSLAKKFPSFHKFGWDVTIFGLTFSHLVENFPSFYKFGWDISLFGWYFFTFGYYIFLLG